MIATFISNYILGILLLYPSPGEWVIQTVSGILSAFPFFIRNFKSFTVSKYLVINKLEPDVRVLVVSLFHLISVILV